MGGNGFKGGRGGFLTDEEKQNSPKITSQLLKRMFSYLIPYWKQLIVSVLAIIISSVFGVFPTILTGRIIDEGLLQQDMPVLIRLIGLSLGVLIIANLISVVESYVNVWMAENITYDMRNKMYSHLQRMSHRFFTTSKQGDIITRMTSDIGGVQSVLTGTWTSILQNFATLMVALVTMYTKSPLLATIGIVVVPLFILPTKRVGKRRWEITLASRKHNDDINQILNETLSVSGQLLSKLFVTENYEFNRYQEANKQMIRLNIKESMAGKWFRVVINVFTNIGPMLIYLVGGILIIEYGNTDLTIGDITVMVALLGRMYGPVNSLLNIQVDMIRSMALFDRIFEYFDLPVEIDNDPEAIKPELFTGELVFEEVSFHYDAEQPILNNVSFELKPGSSVAIVGPSGAGKSTIINLIPRLYDVTGGRILLDGVDIRKLDLAYLRQHIGVVTQDTYLFNGTIKENLLYAKADATQAEIEKACSEANIHTFISGLPKGYDTIVGNRGMKLSGGEKQRLSIARIILRKPGLIIFDEATSSLDSISEHAIQQAIAPILAKSTSLIIAHRLSTILSADEILVLEKGKIIERGDHETLVKKGGIYTTLYETQMRV
ncbi:ABC transporter ATP-binding protein [Trichococcus collinsii]|uniref:ATP-binding cassette, subfamily B n=1 Tax=Trichococcus collinsii TaxID=157076 RepID=A0AB38A3A8_9LACT|nr:ABC transporter ATP-binding protein [Trichococcus collinsii]CZR00177.1 abc transporter [Trichococcus collinsii]SEA88432.1 ATP-binding cassette, subfamily B [Trichococcus collinsii]